MNIQIIEAGLGHQQIVALLFQEYAAELGEDLCFQDFGREVANPFNKYASPAGCILLALSNNEPLGCIALQSLPHPGTCEMKRLYVRPSFRSSGAGSMLIEKLIETATTKGYQTMVLDTLQRLQPAIRLYERYGFVNTLPYYANPLPGVVYMEKVLCNLI